MTLVAQAREMLAAVAAEDPSYDPADTLRPLLTAALDNALRDGDAALTGPMVRGDAGTVSTHLTTLTARAPESVAGYLALARRTADRAIGSGRLRTLDAADLLGVLTDTLFERAALTIPHAANLLDVPHRTARLNIGKLVDAGIFVEVGERARNKLFLATGVLRAVEGQDEPSGHPHSTRDDRAVDQGASPPHRSAEQLLANGDLDRVQLAGRARFGLRHEMQVELACLLRLAVHQQTSTADLLADRRHPLDHVAQQRRAQATAFVVTVDTEPGQQRNRLPIRPAPLRSRAGASARSICAIVHA